MNTISEADSRAMVRLLGETAALDGTFKQMKVFLMSGLDRKSIAAHLGISANTVAGYAREVYRHFGVNSQPQLIRRFFTPTSSA